MVSPKILQSIQVYHHVINKVMDINGDEIDSFAKWMTYRRHDNFTDLCVDFYYELDHIHDDRILDFFPFLQYFQLVSQDGLSMGNRGFASEGLKQIKIASTWV